MKNGQKVSAEVAAKLAEKYPRFADVAAEAVVGDLVVTRETKPFVNELGVLDKKTTVLSKHRKFRLPDGSSVVLDEVDEVPKATVVVPDANPVVEPAKAAKPEPKSEPKKVK